jgi:hypothetical protein
MRRTFAVILCALLFAQPALGQQKAKPKPALRGAIVASQPVPNRSPAPPPPALDALGARSLFLPTPIASAPVGGAPQQCRLACAQTYYFCLASDFPDQCPISWGQCRAGCDSPTLTTSY